MRRILSLALAALTLTFNLPLAAQAAVSVKIKNLATLGGVRDNQLIGYGLVTGLNGTGDGTRARFTLQSISNMLQRFKVTIDPSQIRVNNVASVLVTASLPPYAREGSKLDVHISSIGDAESLEGGILLMTPLFGPDGKMYAAAQGPVTTGGRNQRGGGSQVKNHTLTALLPNGGIVERALPSQFNPDGSIQLLLAAPDFITASRVVATINLQFSQDIARAVDPQTIDVAIPPQFQTDPVTFIAVVEDLAVEPETPARIVINERTGTIVMGEAVRIGKVAVSHGNLSVSVKDKTNPAVMAAERVVSFADAPTVDDVVKALNAVGAQPRDIISILEAFRASGALYAELVLM